MESKDKDAKNSGKSGFFTDNQLLEDLSRMAGNAFGALAGLRQEIEVRVKEQFENFAAKLDMVRRDEFEAVKEMAAKMRTEQESLKKRIEELEEKSGEEKSGGKKTGAKK